MVKGEVWHTNRIAHMYNPDTKMYNNLYVQTSKMNDILRVSISAQYLFINETSNDLNIVVKENGFAYPPIELKACLTMKQIIELIDSKKKLQGSMSTLNQIPGVKKDAFKKFKINTGDSNSGSSLGSNLHPTI